jgi:radical SAM protein with 4Fe4S-binding SPASM domain
MGLDLFEEILDMLQTISDFPEVYLVGGEPTVLKTLHSYLDAIERRGWTATVYTNGGFGRKQRDVLLESRAVARMTFHYDEFLFETYKWLRPRWLENLSAMAANCDTSVIGVIDGPKFPFLDLVDLAAAHEAALTWIFSTPTSGGTPFLGLHEMRALGANVQEMHLRAKSLGVRCAPDLPIPLCIFDPDFLKEFAEEFALVRRCRPFAYFQVDGRVSYCTAMPIFTAPRPSTPEELAQTIELNRSRDVQLKHRPSFPECQTCEYHLKQRCQGGCMTYKVYGEKQVVHGVKISFFSSATSAD